MAVRGHWEEDGPRSEVYRTTSAITPHDGHVGHLDDTATLTHTNLYLHAQPVNLARTRVRWLINMMFLGDPRGILTRLRCKKKRSGKREDAKQQVNDRDGSLQSTEQVNSRGSIHSRELERELLPCYPVVCSWQGRYIQFHTTATSSSSQQGNKFAPTRRDICSKIEYTGLDPQGTPQSSDWENEWANNSYAIRLRGASLSSYYRAIKEKPQQNESPWEWLVGLGQNAPPEHTQSKDKGKAGEEVPVPVIQTR